MWAKHKQPGFTIVELLIVIVVIGILAAISIVAYNGIQSRAVAAALTSDLDNNSKLLKLFQVDNGAFPATINCAVADSATNKCLKTSSGNVLTYQYSNASNPQGFCINASKGGLNYRITNDTTPVIGNCTVFYATGGTIADVGGYRIHTFTGSGTFTANIGISTVEVLVVAGGGSGGTSGPGSGGGGGGGAGGLIYNPSYSVSLQSDLAVTIGGGGAAVVTGALQGLSGGNSVFGSLSAIGGGGGGASGGFGTAGGSGGGAGYNFYAYRAGSAGTSGQGNNGGDTLNSNNAGGGGGAGGVGGNTYDCRPGTCTIGSGGLGGPGLAYSVSGVSATYAKGGEGGGPPSGLASGATNSGNGGAGVYSNTPSGGAGGSGIVIVRYLLP